LVEDKGIHVTLDDDAVNHLVKKGFNTKMGARPLQREINEQIKLPLSKEMLFGRLTNGGIAEITVEEDKLKINILDPFPKTEDEPETEEEAAV
jgi:ATP-dependent Clp protease ATP-binding subunit ClpA